jgi:hypothetical protein
MSIEDEISKGIGAHGKWKQRILTAVETGQSEWTPETVRQDNQCDFDKWLYSCSSLDKVSPHYEKVKELHAHFHTVAGGVLDMALTGDKKEAESAVNMDSEYRVVSSKLTSEMMAWKRNVS